MLVSINLTPKQRAVIKRTRKAIALLPEPERSILVAALKEFFQMALATMLADIERKYAELSAISLALEERLGHEPFDGEVITPSDERRAQEILEMYPKVDT
jgi:hypothetical protein